MPATKWGVYHNLKESEYVVSNREITFFFSSEFYLNKFLDSYKENRKKFIKKMKAEMNHNPLHLNMETLADVNLYKTIEKRGFLSYLYDWEYHTKGVEMDWQEIQKYALRKMTVKNTRDWLRIPKPKLKEQLKMLVDL
jgi:hypothetical protein